MDIAFDGTGKTPFDTSVSALGVGGTFVTYGYAGGHIPPIDLWRFVFIRSDGPEQPIEQWRRRAL